MNEHEEQRDRKFPATVVKVIDDYQVAINRGSNDGVNLGDKFSIYGVSEDEIIDPDSGESLGKLEIFKGSGEVINVQKTMATIMSTEKKPLRKEIFTQKSTFINPLNPISLTPTQKIVEFPEENLPFREPIYGDKVKPI